MSNKELQLILNIFDFKEVKSNAIFYQKYSEAATARDKERDYESELVKFLGHNNSSDNIKILNEYFIKNFDIEYPKKISNQLKNNILRQIKLNNLGI